MCCFSPVKERSALIAGNVSFTNPFSAFRATVINIPSCRECPIIPTRRSFRSYFYDFRHLYHLLLTVHIDLQRTQKVSHAVTAQKYHLDVPVGILLALSDVCPVCVLRAVVANVGTQASFIAAEIIVRRVKHTKSEKVSRKPLHSPDVIPSNECSLHPER